MIMFLASLPFILFAAAFLAVVLIDWTVPDDRR